MQKVNNIKKFDFNIHTITEILKLLQEVDYIRNNNNTYTHISSYIETYKQEHGIDRDIELHNILEDIYNTLEGIQSILKLEVGILYNDILKEK